jgi:serine/threonine protein phosphatase PrpC
MTDNAESAGTRRALLDHAALSDIGLRRANNQDSFAVAVSADGADAARRGDLFMVADGMGAHAAGELASKIACDSVPHSYRKLLDRSPADALRQAVLAANASIHERGQANAEFQGMGTTCSALVLVGGSAIVAHVGDSRVYRLRHETLDQLTFDHSLVWEMMAVGQMPRGEVAGFIPKNIITRSLGPHVDVQVDMEGPFSLQPGDTFLLCSDGLSGQLKDEEIGAILLALSPNEAARALVDMANLRGGPDNITALVIRVASLANGDSSQSIQHTSDPASPSVHPILWGAMALGMLLSVSLVLADKLAAALAAGLATGATAVVALLANLLKSSPPMVTGETGPLGSGPHSTHDCTPNAERAAVLCQMAQQLREAAKEEHWTLDWARFNAHGEQAQAAIAAGDFGNAVRQYALAIVFMMSQIRHQTRKDRGADGSVLDL